MEFFMGFWNVCLSLRCGLHFARTYSGGQGDAKAAGPADGGLMAMAHLLCALDTSDHGGSEQEACEGHSFSGQEHSSFFPSGREGNVAYKAAFSKDKTTENFLPQISKL